MTPDQGDRAVLSTAQADRFRFGVWWLILPGASACRLAVITPVSRKTASGWLRWSAGGRVQGDGLYWGQVSRIGQTLAQPDLEHGARRVRVQTDLPVTRTTAADIAEHHVYPVKRGDHVYSRAADSVMS